MKKVLKVLVKSLLYRDEGIKGSNSGEFRWGGGGRGECASTQRGILQKEVNFEQGNLNCPGTAELEMNISILQAI